jgi:F-box-like
LDEALLDVPQDGLLLSDHELSAQEMASARDSVALRHSALEALTATFEILEAYQLRLKQSLNLYEGILSPIRHLPDEILQEIFIQVSLARGSSVLLSDPEGTYESRGNAPIIALERVCSRWLRLCRSTVELWTSLDYESLPADPTRWVPLMAFSDRLLDQSKNAPLSMAFFPSSSDFSDTAKAARALHPPIFDKLSQSTQRWQELCADPGSIASLQAAGMIPSTLPSLKTIDLAQCWWQPMCIANNPEHPIQPLNLPNLHTIFLANMIKHGAPPSHNYDFIIAPNFQHLDVTEFYYSRLCFPKLTTSSLDTLTLTLNRKGAGRISPADLSELLFPELKTLHVQTRADPWGEGIPWILRALTCPSLTSLCIGADPNAHTERVKQSLSDFISRSGCRIESLTLSNIHATDLMEVLDIHNLKSISHLSIRMSLARMDDVNEAISCLESYRLQSLWVRVEAFSGRAEPLLSVPALSRLCEADIWRKPPDSPCRARLELRIPIDEDVARILDDFCRASRLSTLHFSYGNHPAHWERHLIDELENDLPEKA